MGNDTGSMRSGKGVKGAYSKGGGKSTGGNAGSSSQFTAEEERGIASVVDKLKSAPADVRATEIDRADRDLRGKLQDRLTEVTKLKRTVEETRKYFEKQNPGRDFSTHPINKDLAKAQERYESAQKNFDRFREIKRRLS